MSRFWDLLFGCTHRHYTFPITSRRGQRRPEAAKLTGTYVVCLQCARELPYDWHQMRVIPLTPPQSKTLAETTEIAQGAA
jgi:hypothetical protein